MSGLGKGLLIGFVALLVLIALGITFTIGWRPFLGPSARVLTDRKFESTPQRLQRGKYLASGCIYCHSPHDWGATGTPIQAGMEGSGEQEPYADLPGRIVAPNLTPDKETGAGTWTDDMFARAIREGVGHDGRALFPLMPYANFREFSDEDIASILVYAACRSLSPSPFQTIADPNSPKYAAPMAKVAGCADCHTPTVQGGRGQG